jgi:hypothetical protein
MIEQARLERVASGLAPVTPGWFVVNAREAAHHTSRRAASMTVSATAASIRTEELCTA